MYGWVVLGSMIILPYYYNTIYNNTTRAHTSDPYSKGRGPLGKPLKLADRARFRDATAKPLAPAAAEPQAA